MGYPPVLKHGVLEIYYLQLVFLLKHPFPMDFQLRRLWLLDQIPIVQWIIFAIPVSFTNNSRDFSFSLQPSMGVPNRVEPPQAPNIHPTYSYVIYNLVDLVWDEIKTFRTFNEHSTNTFRMRNQLKITSWIFSEDSIPSVQEVNCRTATLPVCPHEIPSANWSDDEAAPEGHGLSYI